MIFELIYTSYPRGLQSGTSGFTPVAYTEGMPRSYIELCESLSGYPFVYPLGDPRYEENPEIYTHYRFKVNANYKFSGDYSSKLNGDYNLEAHKYEKDEISILSRVAVAGKDYTGRENKIAHHIIFDNNERLKFPLGPAWLVAYANFFVKQWDKTPCLLPPNRLELDNLELISLIDKTSVEEKEIDKIKIDRSAITLNSWSNIFGNVEPAYLLSKSAESNQEIPSFILFDQENNIPNLLAEALSLVAPERRWDITFNTHFISKPMDSDCLWRFCPKQVEPFKINSLNYTTKSYSFNDHYVSGDYLSNIIEKYPNSLVIDLTNKTIQGKIPIIKPFESSCNIKSFESSGDKNINKSSLTETGEDEISPDNLSSEKDVRENIFIQPQKGEQQSSIQKDNYRKSFLSLLFSSSRKIFWIFLSIVSFLAFGFLYTFYSNNFLNITLNNTPNIKANNHSNIKSEIKPIAKNERANIEDEAESPKNRSSEIKTHKKLLLSFYENSKNVSNEDRIMLDEENKIGSVDNAINGGEIVPNKTSKITFDLSEFKNIKCRLLTKDGTEIETNIESPIIKDTPNLDILHRDLRESLGNISMEKISLYDKNLYSAIYLEQPSKEHIDLIWVTPLNISESMISKLKDDSNTLEIRFDPKMSKLIYQFLSLLESDNLTGFVELHQDIELKPNQESSKSGAGNVSNGAVGATSNGDVDVTLNGDVGVTSNGDVDPTKGNAKENKDNAEEQKDNAKENKDNAEEQKDNAKENKAVDKLIFNPKVSIKADLNNKDKNSAIIPYFIQLTFTDIRKDIENDKLFKELKIKQLRIDYNDKQRNRTYPILCMICQ
ncbi:MAG: hypothetical protein HQK63_10660 [Desulfamplus sp.]|nr:hypothetical protein [Desulfamplus sp.]